MNQLISLQAAIDLIQQGKALSLAGTEATLDKLPAGNWIAGTIPYFMVAEGGTVVQDDRVFATDLSDVGDVTIACYGASELEGIAGHAPDNGFALTVIPAASETHRRFSAEASSYKDAFLKPTVGWIAGVHLNDLGKASPKVYDGRTASKHTDRAVVAYVALPADKLVQVDIVNLFEPDGQDTLRFQDTSFNVRECEVNGEKMNFAEYVNRRGLAHGQLPLVGDFAGAHVNVSLQKVHADHVDLFAPVFPGVDYHFARPVSDYAAAFRSRLAEQDTSGTVVSCNCILNFVFGELEGKAIGGVQGPATFGEIAYQLVNQTLVNVRVL